MLHKPDNLISYRHAGFLGATDVSGEAVSIRGYQTGKYGWFGNALWSPTVKGMGVGSYNFLAYYQPSVPMQPGQSTGVSLAMSQSLSQKYGIFARASYASGTVLQITSSFGGGGIINDPLGAIRTTSWASACSQTVVTAAPSAAAR